MIDHLYTQATQHHRQGNLAAAEGFYHQVLRLAPGHVDARCNLSLLFIAQGRYEAARESLEAVLAYAGNNLDLRAAVLGNLGMMHRNCGRTELAESHIRQALALRPDLAMLWNNLAEICFQSGCVAAALEHLSRARQLDPAHSMFASNAIFFQQFDPALDRGAQRVALDLWRRTFAEPHRPSIRPHTNNRDPERRLRIGFVSADFREHVVAQNLMPLFRRLDRRQFEVVCYAELVIGDRMTEEIKRLSTTFRPVLGMSDEDLAQLIRQDAVDILVDLSLHMGGNRLGAFARKPAPVQVTFAGYPGSTGLDVIDYRLTDPHLDPPEHDCWYAEKSFRLPASFWCYEPEESPPVVRLPALGNGFVTFGCLNSFAKVNSWILTIWGRVLAAVAESRLVLLAGEGAHRRRLQDTLERMGIAPQRVMFFTARPRAEYLGLYEQIDIGLDTLPYNGHTTSLDSCFMGVPVVTLVGSTVVGRAGLSQLTNLGMPELIAQTPEEFVRIAADLARDTARLAEIRSGLRQRMQRSPLMDAAGFARGIEAAFRQMWRTWCAGEGR